MGAQYRAQRGSVLGGLTGAAAGALIGGAVGLVAGAALGNARDRQFAENRAFQFDQQQLKRQLQYQQQRQLAQTVTIHDAIAMSRSGLSDAVIINHIQSNGVRQDLQVADVITLHENGVSQQVITAMEQSRPSAVAPPAIVQAPVYPNVPPIVVEQYVAPRYIYPSPRQYYGARHHQHSSPAIHFSFRP